MIIKILVIAAFILLALMALRILRSAYISQSQKKAAGRKGERIATGIISGVLRDDDYLFTNVEISYDGKRTELDNVVVNSCGVFIIEVKNYKGRLYGAEDDYEWQKFKDDGYGNTFEKNVKNPIKQVQRQTYILARHLKQHGADAWVEGYALLINNNSPVQSNCVLSSVEDIDRAIHTCSRKPLDKRTVSKIRRIFD